MPYYPDDQSKKNLERIRHKNVCSRCGGAVWVYLNLKTKQNYIACTNFTHEGLVNEYIQPREDNESNIRREMELTQQVGPEASTAVSHIPKQGQLTKAQAMHILKLVYPNCPEEEIVRCAILCRDFGLHPLMKEVYLIPFKGKDGNETYVTVLGINATRKLMALRGSYSYFDDTPRLMTPEEQKRVFGEVDSVNIVAITKLRTKDGLEAPGYGRWPKDKSPQGMDKGNTKANMAFIRSERNAFGRLSPDALPPNIEVIDEAYVDVPEIGKVEKSTGEIIESTATVVEEPLDTGEETHWCEEHNCAFELKKGKWGDFYSHKTDGGWCKEKKAKAEETTPSDSEPEPTPEATESKSETIDDKGNGIDMVWLKDSLKTLEDKEPEAWSESTLLLFMMLTYKVEAPTVLEAAAKLDKGEATHFVNKVQETLAKA